MLIPLLLACLSPGGDSGACDSLDCDGDRWLVQYDCDDHDPSAEASRPTAYYPDADGDGMGTHAGAEGFCENPGVGWVTNADDCDDSDPESGPHPCQ